MTRASILVAAVAAGLLVAGIVPASEAALRVGKNYRLASDPAQFRGKDAVALRVNPSNPQHIVEVNANYLSQECEYTVSLDGGTTWSRAASFRPPAPGDGQPFVPTCRASDHLADFMFQTVVFGSGQNVYATFSTPRRTAAGGEQGSSVLVAKSVDGGRTFGQAVVAMAGGSSGSTRTGGPYYELPSVAADPGAGPGGADRIIVAAREVTNSGDTGCVTAAPAPCAGGDAVTAVSIDGGQTFSGPLQVEPAGENVAGPDTTSPPVVLPDHSLAIAWRQAGTTGAIKVARGTFAGQTLTWGPPVTAAIVTNNAANTANPPSPSPSTGSSFPRMAVDKASGNLYLVYNQGPSAPGAPAGGFQGADHFIPPDSDVWFQRSTTQGATWSTPKQINNATKRPGHESPANPREYGVVTQTRHPEVSVAPNGRVDIVWEDRRHWYRGCIHTHVRCEEARLGDTYYAFSNDKGSTFARNKRINDRSSNNDVGFDYRFGTGWAFGPVMAHLGNSQLLVGWMDSREGSFENDNQDIYLAKVDHEGPVAAPQESITRSGLAETSVRLSQFAYPGGGEGLLASTFATRNGTRVVIVNENDVAAVLAAGVLARANLSQVLLSPPGGLPAGVKAEVARMTPAGAYVIGDEGSLSNQVIQDLQAAGVPSDQVERLGGANDSGTARAIAEKLDRRTQAERDTDTPAFNAAAIVNPYRPDASAVSALASARRLPILFATRNSLPPNTTAALSALDIDTALVVGGPRSVSDAVVGRLPGTVTAKRLGGANQYATSRAVVAESRARGLPVNIGYVADGARPIDGALLGSTVGRVTGLLMLSPAPLSSRAARTAKANKLRGRLDRLVLLQEPVLKGCPPARAARSVLTLTNAGDTRNGTPGADLIFAAGGNDVINALAGGDRVDLGPGADRGRGSAGNDCVVGRKGADRISGSSGKDRLLGNAGRDRLNGGSGRDRLGGGSGNDRIRGGRSGDVIRGGAGKDRLAGNAGRDRISGGSGNDRILAKGGQRDRIRCGRGFDRVIADRLDRVGRDCEQVRR